MMGGRTLPTECEHGVVLDWGDHGPDPDDGQAGVEPCAECEAARPAHKATIVVEWGRASDVPEGVIHSTIENAIDLLMAQLVCMGVTDPFLYAKGVRIRVTRDDLDGGWVAERIDLPGCISQGDTEAEAVRNLADAAEVWLTIESKENPDA